MCCVDRLNPQPRAAQFRALLLRCLQCALALRAEFRLIVFQALLRLLTLLTLAQLLDLGFARLFGRARVSRLTPTLAPRLSLGVGACGQGCDEKYWQHSHGSLLI